MKKVVWQIHIAKRRHALPLTRDYMSEPRGVAAATELPVKAAA